MARPQPRAALVFRSRPGHRAGRGRRFARRISFDGARHRRRAAAARKRKGLAVTSPVVAAARRRARRARAGDRRGVGPPVISLRGSHMVRCNRIGDGGHERFSGASRDARDHRRAGKGPRGDVGLIPMGEGCAPDRP